MKTHQDIHNNTLPTRMKNGDWDLPESERIEFSQWLLESLRNRFEFPTQDSIWTKNVIEQCVRKILNDSNSSSIKTASPSLLSSSLREQADTLLPSVFFVPEVVNLLYSNPDNATSLFVNEGLRYHSRFVRRAVKTVVGRFIPRSDFLSIGKNELEDELWSCTLEEILRCLTDYSARLWSPEGLLQSFPPEGLRGKKLGVIFRVALSEDGGRLVTVQSDHTLILWDTKIGEMIRLWDLYLLQSQESPADKEWSPPHVFFSPTSERIAIEVPTGNVLVVSESDYDPNVRTYTEKNKKQFIKDFGLPFLPDFSPNRLEPFKICTRNGLGCTLNDYISKVYDWSGDREGRFIATASEKERCMPKWMKDIGFDKAVYLIAKRRLIDLIRKHTQTGFRCWHCGANSANPDEFVCSQCGADFTLCPLGCPIPPSERLDRGNHWTCPHCQCRSRVIDMQEIVHEDFDRISDDSSMDTWKDRHDLNRIYNRLQRVFVTYKDRQIACDVLIRLKTEGKTNEEIGRIFDIPRGSVDYIWNQCRKQALLVLGPLKRQIPGCR